MAKNRKTGGGAGVAALGLLAACCLAKPLFDIGESALPLVVLLFLAVAVFAQLTRLTASGAARRGVPRTARLSRREFLSQHEAEDQRRAEERRQAEAERIEKLARRYDLPNPTVAKFEAEEQAILDRIHDEWRRTGE